MTRSSTPSRPKVLYVEDEVIVALDVADGLALDLGYEVSMAHNLTTAFEMTKTIAFDYALLDLNLGHGERSITLGEMLAKKGTHVVFASGYNREEINEIADYLMIEKPFQIEDVARAFKSKGQY